MRLFGTPSLACAAGLALVLGTVGASTGTFQRRPSPGAATTGPIRVQMRNVVLYPFRDAPSHVMALSGTVAPTRAGGTVVLDDISSYGIMVQHAEVALSPATMTVLMNRYILPASNGPIKHVEVSFGAGTIGMSGIIQKGKVRARFKASAVASPTADGDMRIRIVKMTAGGFVPKGLMDAVGLKMDKVAQPRNKQIFHVVGDDMIVPVVSMFPPPKVSGKLRSVSVRPGAMTAVIGSAGTPAMPALGPSYIHYRGGVLKFAKLTMRDVDLTVVPKTSAPLGFSPANYYRQMEAGFSVPQPDRGLVAHVPNYTALVPAPK
jgi:hypothetical protein